MENIFKTILDGVELYDSLESTENPSITLKAGVEIQVLDINLGSSFEFCKVMYENEEYYALSCFFEGTSQQFQTRYSDEFVETNASAEISIDDIEVSKPFKKDGKYHIVIETGIYSKVDLEAKLKVQDMTNLKVEVLEEFLTYYGKDFSKITESKVLQFILNPFDLIKVTKYHYSTRPNKSIKVSFSIDEKYLDMFENMNLDKFQIENLDKDFISMNFYANELEKDIKKVIKILNKYDKMISKFSGSVEGLDISFITTKMQKFYSDFKATLKENGYTLSKTMSNKIEIGFNKATFKLEYIIVFGSPGKFLNIGVQKLGDRTDTKVTKTLLNMKKIKNSGSSGNGWMPFLKENYGGDFDINFKPPSDAYSTFKKPLTAIQKDIDKYKFDLDEFSISDYNIVSEIDKLKKNDVFRQQAAELLMRSRDLVGDNFLLNLQDILANVNDISSLYDLVLNKVSTKDLIDFMMEAAAEHLDLPDIQEIQARAALLALSQDELLDLLFEYLDLEGIRDLNMTFCDIYNFKKEEFDLLLGSIKVIPQDVIGYYLMHYKTDMSLGGMIPEEYQGDIENKLKEYNLENCAKLYTAISSGKFEPNNFFQEKLVGELICHILSNGFPKYELINPCPDIQLPSISFSNGTGSGGFSLPSFNLGDIKIDIFDFFGRLEKHKVFNAVDVYFKDRFKKARIRERDGESGESQSDLIRGLLKMPKIKMQIDKIKLTKKKLLSKKPNININFEQKKIDSPYSFPNIKDVNPSFDLEKFKFSGFNDIFGSSIEDIEKNIKEGVEKAILTSFKNILNRVLDGLNFDFTDLDMPDFGSLNFNKLFDAYDGFNSDLAINIVLPKFNRNVKISGDLNIKFDKEHIRKVFDDISKSSKPMEVIRIIKGDVNKKDYDNLHSTVSDENVSAVLSEELFIDIFETLGEFADLGLLEDLENAYDNKEVFESICLARGIPYNYDNIKNKFKDNYNDLTEDEIDNLANNVIDEVKDSLVDAISSIQDNYNDKLPFDENPCSFMPPQSSIPAMNFVNNLIFDNVFNTIEMEYRSEASVIQDAFLVPAEADEYVKMRHQSYDYVFVESKLLPDGTYEPIYDQIKNLYPDEGLDFYVYNKEFGYNYYGDGDELYIYDNGEYKKTSEVTLKKKDEEWVFKSSNPPSNVYVKKRVPTLQPIPETGRDLENITLEIIGSRGRLNLQEENNRFSIYARSRDIVNNLSFKYNKVLVTNENYDINSGEFECLDDVITVYEYSKSVDMKETFKEQLNQISKNSSLSEHKIDSYKEAIEYEDSVLSDSNKNAKSLISRIMFDLTKNVLETTIHKDNKVSKLFQIQEMLSFVVDGNGIDLLKLQDAKDAAKNEFNSSCSFAENDNSLQNSSMKQLIYLFIRVQIIEELIMKCMLYDNSRLTTISDSLYFAIYHGLINYLSKQKDEFQSIFEKKYLEIYKEDYHYESPSFRNIVSSCYQDISSYFSLLFRKSDDFLFSLISKIKFITDSTYELYSSVEEAYNAGDNLVFQTFYRHKDTKEEIMPRDHEILSDNEKRDYTKYVTLCYIIEYIKDKEGIEISERVSDSDYELIEGSTMDFYKLKGSVSGELVGYSRQENANSWDNTTLFAQEKDKFYLLPIAESEIIDLSTISTYRLILEDKSLDKPTVYKFLMDIAKVDFLRYNIEELIKQLQISEKQEIGLLFMDTKNLIRRNFITLNQNPDAFEYQEAETANVQMEQSKQISTTPDFSMKAKKMALLTVPMIIKGFAEQFDPNIKISSKIRNGASLSGLDIPPPVASLMALPINIVPFSPIPGPPIGPLGLLYLASGFLDPKERNKLANLKRGKNLNPSADPDTGTFSGGTLEEQISIIEEQSKLGAEYAQEKYLELINMIIKPYFSIITEIISGLRFNLETASDYFDSENPWIVKIPSRIQNNPIDLYMPDIKNSWDTIALLSISSNKLIEIQTQVSSLNNAEQYLNMLTYIKENWFSTIGTANASPIGILKTYLKYIKNIKLETGSSGYKIDNFLHDVTFKDARALLQYLTINQLIIERITILMITKILNLLEREIPQELESYNNNVTMSFQEFLDAQWSQLDIYRVKLNDAISRDKDSYNWEQIWGDFRSIYSDRYEQLEDEESLSNRYSTFLLEFLEMDYLQEFENLYRLSNQ